MVYSQDKVVESGRSKELELAAFILGIISIVCCVCIWLSIICGALAIILALISRGGNMKMTTNAKAAVIMSVIGMVFTISVYGASYYMIIRDYGTVENYVDKMSEETGIDYNALLEDAFSTSDDQE